MVTTLEAIKGGGGSIKVGATGTISTLMSRELDSSAKSAPSTPKLCRNKCPVAPNLVPPAPTTPRKLKPRTSMDEASSSTTTTTTTTNQKSTEIPQKTKHHNRRNHRAPMHKADNISNDGTPRRQKPDRRGSYIVEVVDIKCGNPDRAWAAPITNRLKKLGFSKLSETIA